VGIGLACLGFIIIIFFFFKGWATFSIYIYIKKKTTHHLLCSDFKDQMGSMKVKAEMFYTKKSNYQPFLTLKKS